MVEEEILAKIVGAGNVSCKQTALDEYSRDISFVNRIMPDYVVKPRNTEDIKKIVKLASEVGWN